MTTTISKREIQSILKTGDRTSIFRLAKMCGVDVTSKSKVYHFMIDNAPSKSVSDRAYQIALYPPNYKEFQHGYVVADKMPIADAIAIARRQKKEGYSSYSKILIVGNTHIYWASPVYRLEDYNKFRAFENTEKFRKVAELINKFLSFPTYED